MKRKSGKTNPSVEDDRRNLDGVWMQPRQPGYGPRLLWVSSSESDAEMRVCDFGHDRVFGSQCWPVERDGARLMTVSAGTDDEVVLFRYRLDGDTLELFTPPAARDELWAGQNAHPWDDLVGKWVRVDAS